MNHSNQMVMSMYMMWPLIQLLYCRSGMIPDKQLLNLLSHQVEQAEDKLKQLVYLDYLSHKNYLL